MPSQKTLENCILSLQKLMKQPNPDQKQLKYTKMAMDLLNDYFDEESKNKPQESNTIEEKESNNQLKTTKINKISNHLILTEMKAYSKQLLKKSQHFENILEKDKLNIDKLTTTYEISGTKVSQINDEDTNRNNIISKVLTLLSSVRTVFTFSCILFIFAYVVIRIM